MNKSLLKPILAGLGLLCAVAGSAVRADDYSSSWGPAVGSPMPMLEAPDHTGTLRNFDSLAGEHGLLLFLNRSAEW